MARLVCVRRSLRGSGASLLLVEVLPPLPGPTQAVVHRAGDPEWHPRWFVEQVARARREDQRSKIRLHDLRHTRAILLLTAGEPVHPDVGRQVADRCARC